MLRVFPAAKSAASVSPKQLDAKLRLASWATLGVTAALILLLLALVARMPLGPMYWDSEIYLDAAYRIDLGQMPSVDFFAPVGPLDYYLFAVTAAIFPHGQPVLVASWSVALVTIPLMALFVAATARKNPAISLLVVLPFAIFTLLPFNTGWFYPFPGADGFGIYNRHGVQLLYVLAASLLFVRDQRILAIIVTTAMAAMFGIKITAFLAGGLLCLGALLAGRVTIVTALASITASVALVGSVEFATGMVSAYLSDIDTLASMNQGDMAARLFRSVSRDAGVVLPVFALIALLLVPGTLTRRKSDRSAFRRLFDHPATWLTISIVAGILYESENTGSQDHIFVWPAILFALRAAVSPVRLARSGLIAFLAACAMIPVLVNTSQNAIRAVAGSIRQYPLAQDHLGTMGAVLVRPVMQTRADVMRDNFIAHPDAMTDLAEHDELNSFLLYSDLDFQLGHLRETDEAIGKLKALAAKGFAYRSVMTLDFTNPFPWLLGTDAPRHITIGAVPGRTVPPMNEAIMDAVRATDVILEPRCPFRRMTLNLRRYYEPAMIGRTEVELTPCYRAWLTPDALARFEAASSS